MHKLEKLILESYGEVINEMAAAEMQDKTGSNVIQWGDLTDKQRAGIIKRYGEPMFNGEYDFFSSNMETYFKTYSKNKETGQIGHKVIKLPSFGSLYKNFSDIIADIKKLMGSDDIRKDEAAREFFEITKTNFRKLQRYLRTERPEQYRMLKMQRMMEGIEKAFNKIEEGINDHLDLVHVYDKDGRMYGTGSIEKVEGDKTFVRFDGSTVKIFPSNRVKPVKEALGKTSLAESLLDDLKEEEKPQPEEKGDKEAPKDTVLEDATDQILSKFPTLKAAIIKLQTEDFKEFVDSIDWISPRPTEFRINLKNGQDYILKWTGTGFEAQIMGKRYYIDKVNDYQQALDKLAILYKEGPMTSAGEGEPADVDSGGSSGGGGGDFPGTDTAGGGEEEGGGLEDLGGEEGGEEGGADLAGEPVNFEEPAEEPEA